MKPIVIKCIPNQNYGVADESLFKDVIEGVDLLDMTRYIISACNDGWAPTIYWQGDIKEIRQIQLSWVVYSYLTYNKILIIENPYFNSPLFITAEEKKYVSRTSYYNPLLPKLYNPIIDRIINEGYLVKNKHNLDFKLGPSYQQAKREEILNKLI
jgi:hypothetical protein